MRKQRYALFGLLAGVMLVLAGCGGQAKETAADQKEAGASEQSEAGTGMAGAGETSEEEPGNDMAELVGEKGARLLEEITPEELAAMIPYTEVTGTGYYKRYPGEEKPDAKIKNTVDQEITGYMKDYEVISQSWECITAKGIIENDALKTEEAVEAVYYIGINEEETAVVLSSAEIISQEESVHIIPVVPFPTAEELLEMGLSVNVEITPMSPWENLPLTKDTVTDIWYDEKDLQNEMTDWRCIGSVHYVINGFEHHSGLTLSYEAYNDEEAEAKWTVRDPVIDTVKAEETGIEW